MAGAKKAKPQASHPDEKPKAKPKAARPESKAKPKAAPKAGAAKKPARPKKAAAQPKSGSKSKSHSSPDTYTDPELRDKLKEEITAGDKGGKPGQWSARKAQLLAHEYEKAGGGYKDGGKGQGKTEGQKHLDQWTEEDWRTSDDKPADREGGTTRYLPAEAWDKLTPAEKKATNAKKQAGSRKGKQFVGNTNEAKDARKEASADAKSDDAKPKPKSKPRKAAAQAKAEDKPKAKPKAAAKADSKAKPKARKKSS